MVSYIPSYLRIQTHQSRDQNCKEQLTTNTFYDRDTARHVRPRHYIAVSESCQCHETEVDCAGLGKVAREGKCARLHLLEKPVQKADVYTRE